MTYVKVVPSATASAGATGAEGTIARQQRTKIDMEDKYEEALEKARAGKPLEEIFPELKESEDERHRKWILEYLYDGLRKADEQFKGQFKSAIAWLEKQKEQDSSDSNDLDVEIKRFFDECIVVHEAEIYKRKERVIEVGDYELTARHFAKWGEKQKEQKSLPLMNGDADLYFDNWIQHNDTTKRGYFEEGIKYAQRLQKEQKPIIQDVELNDAVYDYVRDHFIAGADFTPEYIKKLMENAFFAGVDYYLLKQESESCEPDTNVEKVIEDVIRVYGKTQGEWVGGYDVDTLIVNLRRAFNKKEQKPENGTVFKGFVAVDYCGDKMTWNPTGRRVSFFTKKPVRDLLTENHYWASTGPDYESIKLGYECFPELKWEDEPVEVELVIYETEQKPVAHENIFTSKPQSSAEILRHYLVWAENSEEDCPYTWKALADAIRDGIKALEEQKPSTPKYRVGDVMRTKQEAAEGITDGLPVIVSVDEDYYYCTSEKIPIPEQEEYEFPPMNMRQKQAEWSEEDEKMVSTLIEYIKKETTRVYRPEWIAWLKSLHSNLKKKNEDVAKLCSNGWSEEDEEMRLEAIRVLVSGCERYRRESGCLPAWHVTIDWLKSLQERLNAK